MRRLLLTSCLGLWLGCAFRTDVPLDGGVSLITCADPTECPRGLACSAKLGRCYDPTSITVDGGLSSLPCESRFDCPRPLTCATDFGFCVQADDVPVDGEGVTTLTCSSRSGCPSPLSCAINLGRCVSTGLVRTDGGISALPCTANSDCVGSLVCAQGLKRCADPAGLVTDGGISTLPCTATSDCIGTLVCATGLGRCADPSGIVTDGGLSQLPCTATSDCIGTLVCATGLRRCADPSGIATDGGISTLPCTSTNDCIGALVCARALGFCTDSSRLPIDDAGISQVPCQFTDDCPVPLACSSRAGLCVDTTRVQLPVIRTARLVDASGQPVTRRSGVAPFDTGRVLVDLALPPVALTARFRTTDTPCVATTPTNWECPLTFSGPSGSEVISLLASDVRGVAVTERLSVLIDADPPRVISGTEALTILPGAGNPLTQLGPSFVPTAVRQDSTVRISLLLDDPNTTSANVHFGSTNRQLPFVRRVGQSFVFEGLLPAALAEGDVALEVTAIDDVGNRLPRQMLTVEPPLRRDVTAPPFPDVTTDDGLIVERVPLGDGTRTGAFVRMRVSPPSGVLVFREATNTPALLALKTSGAAISGQVSTIDQEQLLAQAIDEAGNTSAEVQVQRFRLFVNPGRMANVTHVATTPDLSTPARHEPAVSMPALEAAEGLSLSVAPQPRWEPLHDGRDAGQFFGFNAVTSLIEDTPRRRLLRVSSDPFGTVVTDLANGHHVVTNLPLSYGRYVSACHTSRRTCLLVGNSPQMGTSTLWVLDDQGARLLRTLSGAGTASITFDARREVFLLAQGAQLFTLDEAGTTLAMGVTDCSITPCQVVATPRGVLSAQSGAYAWRARDGGLSRFNGPTFAFSSALGFDRRSLEPVIVDTVVSSLQADGGTSRFALCSPAGCSGAWDPLAGTFAALDVSLPGGLLRDGGVFNAEDAPDPFIPTGWAISEPAGFVLPGSGRWRYREGLGWASSFFPASTCVSSFGQVTPLGVAVDGGWVSWCGRFTSLAATDSPAPSFPFGTWTVSVGDTYVFPNALWRNGVSTPLALSSSSSVPVGVPPNRFFQPPTLYEILPDAGVRSDLFGGAPIMPTTVPFAPPAVGLPFDVWLWSGGAGMPVTFQRGTFRRDGSGFMVDLTTATPVAPEGTPPFRGGPIIVPRSGGRLLLYGGSLFGGGPGALVSDLWALHTSTRPTVHWSVDMARLNVPLDGVVGVQLSATLNADAGSQPVELLAWDPWRASWQVLAAPDGGLIGTGTFVPAASTFDIAVSRLPTPREPLEVDRLEAVIEYRK